MVVSDTLKEAPVQSTTEASIRFASDILRRLGEELNPSPDQSILELVKNAYDADARRCRVELIETELPGGTVRITDDGVGMPLDSILNGWLVVGRSGMKFLLGLAVPPSSIVQYQTMGDNIKTPKRPQFDDDLRREIDAAARAAGYAGSELAWIRAMLRLACRSPEFAERATDDHGSCAI